MYKVSSRTIGHTLHIACLIGALLGSNTPSAHPGDTDTDGCHADHCHDAAGEVITREQMLENRQPQTTVTPPDNPDTQQNTPPDAQALSPNALDPVPLSGTPESSETTGRAPPEPAPVPRQDRPLRSPIHEFWRQQDLHWAEEAKRWQQENERWQKENERWQKENEKWRQIDKQWRRE